MKIFERVTESDIVSTWIFRLNEIIDAFKLVSSTEDGLMYHKDKIFLDSIPQSYVPLRGEISSMNTWTLAERIPSNKETFYLNYESSNVIVMELSNDAVVDLIAAVGKINVFSEKCVCFIPHETNSYTVTLKIDDKIHTTYEVEGGGFPLILKVVFAAGRVFVQEL